MPLLASCLHSQAHIRHPSLHPSGSHTPGQTQYSHTDTSLNTNTHATQALHNRLHVHIIISR